MLGSHLYWITTFALVFCLLMSILRRQTAKQLVEARKKLLSERQQREEMRVELVHARTTAEKDLAAAKKQATDADAARTEIEEEKARLEEERDALRAQLEEARRTVADRTAAEESTKKKIVELEERLAAGRGGVAAAETKLAELERGLHAAHAELDVQRKKLEAEARLRKAAEDERSAAKATATTVEGKLREGERAKAALVETHAKEVKALRDATSALEAELERTKGLGAKAEEELAAERSKVQTPLAGGDFQSALDADPLLNRGQKETIRMTYNQFTAKRRSS